MTACEISVQGSVTDLPETSAFSDALGRLRLEASSLHEDVAEAVAELRRTLVEARATGNMLQNGPLFSNPALKILGGSLIFAVDRVLPKVDDVSGMVETVFEGFDIAAGGAGNPDRVAAIADHLKVEVSAKLVEFADAVSYSRLATPGRWDSPAADRYHFRADKQATDGLRPLAASIEGIARSLEEYADSQVEYANEISALWVDLLRFMVSLHLLALSGISTIGGFAISDAGLTIGKVFQVIGAIGVVGSFLSALEAANSLDRSIERVLKMPHEPCNELHQELTSAVSGVSISWPPFSREI